MSASDRASETALFPVEAHDLVPGAAQALAHVAAHLAQTDQTQLHLVLLVCVVRDDRCVPVKATAAASRGPLRTRTGRA